MESVVLAFVACAFLLVAWSVWTVRRSGERFRDRYRDNQRSGWVKDAQRFAAHPWRWSLRTALLAGLVLAASLGRLWPNASLLSYILVFVVVAIPGAFLSRYWLGPRICRKYLEPSA